MPNDIAARLRSLIEMNRLRKDPIANMEPPSMPERDFGAPAFPDIEAAGSALTAPAQGAPAPKPVPYIGKRFGAG